MDILRHTKKYRQAMKKALELQLPIPPARDDLYTLLEENGLRWWEEGIIWTNKEHLPYGHIRLALVDVGFLAYLEEKIEEYLKEHDIQVSADKREYSVPRPDGKEEYRVVRTFRYLGRKAA